MKLRQMFTPSFLLVLLFLTTAGNTFGSDEHAEGNESHSHGIHHHIGLFLGPTSSLETKYTDFSIGIDYELRFSEVIGLGIFGEHIFSDHKPYIAGGGAFIHPYAGLKFFAAAGVEIIPGENEEETRKSETPGKIDVKLSSEEGSTQTHSEFLVRLGCAYDFHTRGFAFSPTFNADIVNGHVSLVYGLTFGIGF